MNLRGKVNTFKMGVTNHIKRFIGMLIFNYYGCFNQIFSKFFHMKLSTKDSNLILKLKDFTRPFQNFPIVIVRR